LSTAGAGARVKKEVIIIKYIANKSGKPRVREKGCKELRGGGKQGTRKQSFLKVGPSFG